MQKYGFSSFLLVFWFLPLSFFRLGDRDQLNFEYKRSGRRNDRGDWKSNRQ